MTDLEKFVELYKSLGIELFIIEEEGTKSRYLRLSQDLDDRLTGYCGFESSISLDENGKFAEQSFYE